MGEEVKSRASRGIWLGGSQRLWAYRVYPCFHHTAHVHWDPPLAKPNHEAWGPVALWMWSILAGCRGPVTGHSWVVSGAVGQRRIAVENGIGDKLAT